MHSRLIACLVGVAVFLFDIITKYFTHTQLPLMRSPFVWYPYGGIPVFKNFLGIEFSITHQINTGAAWGLLADYQMPLVFMRIGFLIGLFLFFAILNSRRDWDIPLALILAGASGNVLDYFLYGHVVDMFHFVLWGYHYPVFNVADSAICIAIGWLFYLAWYERKPRRA